MPPSKLLLEVADYCWSKNFLDVFRNFFAQHAEDFEGAPAMNSGEHNLKYWELFQTYLKLYESTLENYLKTLEVPIDEFYRDVREAQDQTDDPYITTFIDCLLASADYDSFYKVMAREGNRSLTLKNMGKKVKSPEKAESKAESKETPSRYDEKKGTTTYDDSEKKSAK